MRTVQVIGVPPAGSALPEADAVVVALKSRTNPVAEAVADSLTACEALLKAGARQILVQILLDLRLHRRRQYRPGGECVGCGAPGLRARHHLPGFPGQWPLDLSGLSLRRLRCRCTKAR